MIRILCFWLLQHLPLDRVDPDPESGIIPKTANKNAYQFHRNYSVKLYGLMCGCATLSDFEERLKMFVASKTRTCKWGNQMPQRETDKITCALRWQNFWLTAAELDDVCRDTIMMYAPYVACHYTFLTGL